MALTIATFLLIVTSATVGYFVEKLLELLRPRGSEEKSSSSNWGVYVGLLVSSIVTVLLIPLTQNNVEAELLEALGRLQLTLEAASESEVAALEATRDAIFAELTVAAQPADPTVTPGIGIRVPNTPESLRLPTPPDAADLVELHRDTFASIDSGWDNFMDGDGIVQYDSLEYSITLEKRVFFLGIWGGAGTVDLQRFSLQVEVLPGSNEAIGIENGIVFGWQRDWASPAYAFVLSSGGRCSFRYSTADQRWRAIAGYPNQDPLSPNATHTLQVVVNGGVAYGYVDGNYCAQANLANYKPGLVGLASLGSTGEKTKTYFDNFVVSGFK